MSKNINIVAVIGAGTMGLGIVQIAAMAGYNVQLFDANIESSKSALKIINDNLDKGIEKGKVDSSEKENALSKIEIVEHLSGIKADLVVEAIIENLEIKQALFLELEKLLPEDAILCTNTSSISVTKIASSLKFQDRFLGVHFFNPAHIMKLVEVISGSGTSKETLNSSVSFVSSLKKQPVIANDSPGFIVNRVARQFYVESLKVLEEGVTSFENIDRLMEATGFRMGPFKLMDLIGVDTNFTITSTMYNAFHQDAKFRPSRIQEQMVAAGHFGRKTGQGFYRYD